MYLPHSQDRKSIFASQRGRKPKVICLFEGADHFCKQTQILKNLQNISVLLKGGRESDLVNILPIQSQNTIGAHL